MVVSCLYETTVGLPWYLSGTPWHKVIALPWCIFFTMVG